MTSPKTYIHSLVPNLELMRECPHCSASLLDGVMIGRKLLRTDYMSELESAASEGPVIRDSSMTIGKKKNRNISTFAVTYSCKYCGSAWTELEEEYS